MQVVSSQGRFLESLVYVFALFEELSTAGSVVKIYHIWYGRIAMYYGTPGFQMVITRMMMKIHFKN